MGVTPKIAQHLKGTTKGGLGIDHPVVTVQAADQLSELCRVGQSRGGAGAL